MRRNGGVSACGITRLYGLQHSETPTILFLPARSVQDLTCTEQQRRRIGRIVGITDDTDPQTKFKARTVHAIGFSGYCQTALQAAHPHDELSNGV